MVGRHAAGEFLAQAAAGVDQDHLATGFGVKLDERCQFQGVVGLEQHIAADDEVELPEALMARILPGGAQEGNVPAIV